MSMSIIIMSDGIYYENMSNDFDDITDYGNTTINVWQHNRNLLWKHVNNFGGNEDTKRGQHPHIVRQWVERGLPVQDPQPLVTRVLTHRDLEKQF